MHLRSATILFVVVLSAAFSSVRANPMGFVEDFALAEDRQAAIAQLIPGSSEFYFYQALHDQNEGRLDRVDETIRIWTERHRNDPRLRIIQNRQALLRYPTDARGSLDYVRRQLGVHFNHQRERLDAVPDFPVSLNQDLISRPTLMRRALAWDSNSVRRFEDRALEWLAEERLNENQRRDLLRRLQRPDLANLVDLVMEDLRSPRSGGFGSAGISIHAQMLISQLDEMLRRDPSLLAQTHFVRIYIWGLAPSPDVDLTTDLEAREAYLRSLWAFAQRLPEAHNSIKANVLYQLLDVGRQKGEYNRALFETYIQIPRSVPYIQPVILQRAQRSGGMANLAEDYSQIGALPRIGSDWELVREYLLHFFVDMDSWDAFERYIRDTTLKPLFAEAKILAGKGDMEEWASLISPAQLQQLRDRVDIDFAASNRKVFAGGDVVSLALDIKHVPQLRVRIFEINTLNYYLAEGREVDTDINLDGLVAAEELTFNYAEPPLRRMRRTFELPQLEGPGVWVVEFIGNGRSSRAVIRKGTLRTIEQVTAAGHLFRVVDEANRPRAGAEIHLGGRRFAADGDGLIHVPFTTEPGRQQMVLIDGRRSALDHFTHRAESIELEAGFYVDREQLIRFGKADLLIRPRLVIGGEPAPLETLESVRLSVTAVLVDGTQTSMDVQDFELNREGLSVQPLHVPTHLRRLHFELAGKVRSISEGRDVEVSSSMGLGVNGIDESDKTMSVYLLPTAEGYRVALRGKSGEPLADRPVQVTLKHRDFRDEVRVSLKTNQNGLVDLGAMTDIEQVTAATPEGSSETWSLPAERTMRSSVLHTIAGRPLQVPYTGELAQPTWAAFSLLEQRSGRFVADAFDRLTIVDGYLNLGNLRPGDYLLTLKETDESITIRVTEGVDRFGMAMGAVRHLEDAARTPPQITELRVAEDELRIRVANAGPGMRVAVVASRYVHRLDLFEMLGLREVSIPAAIGLPGYKSLYAANRDLGDEYRYILERRTARRFPGNMLTRPGLLLNPWAVRDTETATQRAAEGEDFGRAGRAVPRTVTQSRPVSPRAERPTDLFATLDFLPAGSVVISNLTADADGLIRVPTADLGQGRMIRVLVTDDRSTLVRNLVHDPARLRPRDLRLAEALDPAVPVTLQKQVTVLNEGDQLVIEDLASSRFQVIDHLGQAYSLMMTLNELSESKDERLAEFRFIVGWGAADDREKERLYSEHASHELHLFLYFKDRPFFDRVVRPYLANKKDKTFVDHWLLGHDLAGYLEPWAFARLNTAERALLARRVVERRESIEAHLVHLHDALVQPDPARFDLLFRVMLESSSLQEAAEVWMKQELLEADAMMPLEREFSGRARGGMVPGQARRESAAMPSAPPPPPAAEAMADMALAQEMARPQRVAELRRDARQFFQKLDATKEWAENNYYKREAGSPANPAELIPINSFWRDFVLHRDGPFLSAHFNMATANFADMMLALAVLDLPFEAPEHAIEREDRQWSMTAAGPVMIFHEEIRRAEVAEDTPLLVSRNYFRHGDRYRQVGNRRVDKFVTEEFAVGVVYGAQLVITNPTSTARRLDLLIQIPAGAIPVQSGKVIEGTHVELQPFSTTTDEQYFYFPLAGQFAQYPAVLAEDGKVAARSEPFMFNVVNQLTQVDRRSWDYISQHGEPEQVLDFLRTENLEGGLVNLAKIAWRMRDEGFFREVIEVLSGRHVFDATLWSYGIHHNHVPTTAAYLRFQEGFLRSCGLWLESPLAKIDATERGWYEHLEYSPLVNARSHELGQRRQILNDRFHQQYHRLMELLAFKPALSDADRLAVVYYLLLQDRFDEGLAMLAKVDRDRIDHRMQYDYLAAWCDLLEGKVDEASARIAAYAEEPVDRWARLFANMAGQIEEIRAGADAVAELDREDRSRRQDQLAAAQPALELNLEGRNLELSHRNLETVTVNYYLMDLELLFSRRPFMQTFSEHFSFIRPNLSVEQRLEGEVTALVIPDELRNTNLMVEVVGGPIRRSSPYFSNTLNITMMESFGQLQVSGRENGQRMSAVYVKVFARMNSGEVRFYKDGYTDLRGRFDYATLSTNELDHVQRFAILIMSDDAGAAVREAPPPKR